jgi:hypothetical protein
MWGKGTIVTYQDGVKIKIVQKVIIIMYKKKRKG